MTERAAVWSIVEVFQSISCSAESPARHQQEKQAIVGVAGVGAEKVRSGQAAKPVCNVLVGGKPSPSDLLHSPHHSLQRLPV